MKGGTGGSRRDEQEEATFHDGTRSMRPLPDARRFLNCIFMFVRISEQRKEDEGQRYRKRKRADRTK